ncbi:MAG TPA: hypothetical protein DIT88_13835, partial [Planctomycetaceae bacterium]|nr:hypothetical protein [Planctomycetaceae bacterium]
MGDPTITTFRERLEMSKPYKLRPAVIPYPNWNCLTLLMLMLLCAFTVKTSYAESELSIEYLEAIKPILKERCFACHGALKQEANLRLDTVAAMRANGILGKDSELLSRITSTDKDIRMPPDGEPLKAHEIMAIKKWVEGGAPSPIDEIPEADPKSHWAFQRIERPQSGFTREDINPIDAYFAARYKSEGLVPQPEAERTVLLRRLYLDVTGLPPTIEQLTSEEPLSTIISNLLDSPQYGERWGRHWMDIWRYSDWYGLGDEVRDSQKNLWRWRDWI